ncbi:MAG: bifunctional precorrin-2 dehydrogenase/sirohydrochlorin ferrochelatase, partial [Deltaproteobacteria bacterium]|nr:bifunctional precorrin-2 dehydrogenase/sirohydrochlorin ferrochelatase [Deltaproteobacteria bacterium]
MNEPYPINLILKNKPVTVIGGGEVAERKITSLIDTGAKITVVAPEATEKIKSLAEGKRLVFKQKNFSDDDIEGSFLVFVSTDSNEVNHRVSRVAREKGVLVNCVDTPEECDFFVPSFFRRGSLALAVSTGGKIPALAKKISRELQISYGEVFAEYVDLLAAAREKIKKEVSLNSQQRKELIENLIDSNLLELLKQGKKQEA